MNYSNIQIKACTIPSVYISAVSLNMTKEFFFQFQCLPTTKHKTLDGEVGAPPFETSS